MVIGRVEVARPVRNVAIRSQTPPPNTNERDGRVATHKAHRVGPLCRWKKNAIKNFPGNMGHRPAARFCALRSVDSSELAKRCSFAFGAAYAYSASFAMRALCSKFGFSSSDETGFRRYIIVQSLISRDLSGLCSRSFQYPFPCNIVFTYDNCFCTTANEYTISSTIETSYRKFCK